MRCSRAFLDGLDVTGPDFIHLVVECSKPAYADREKFYGDPDFVKVPMATLLSDAYNVERRKLVIDKASLDQRPGSVEGFGSVLKLRREEGQRQGLGALGAGEPTVGRMGEVIGDTVHFDIVDQAGNMVSGDALRRMAAIVASDPGAWLLSRHPRADVLLEEGHPLAPGKRSAHALADFGAARRRGTWAGVRRRRQQDQWTTQFFLRHVHANMNLQNPSTRRPALGAFPDFVLARTPPGVLRSKAECPRRRATN